MRAGDELRPGDYRSSTDRNAEYPACYPVTRGSGHCLNSRGPPVTVTYRLILTDPTDADDDAHAYG
jgi:hypothetical protein